MAEGKGANQTEATERMVPDSGRTEASLPGNYTT